jgi:hypothetical protein
VIGVEQVLFNWRYYAPISPSQDYDFAPDGPGGGGRMVHKAIPPTAERPDEVRQKHETLAAGPVRHHVEPGVELRFFRQGADGARNRRDHDGEQAQASKAAMEAIGLNKTYWALTIEPSV